MSVRLAQLLNAASLIRVILSGITNDFIPLQPLKAFLLMVFNLFPLGKPVKEVQPLNVSSPIVLINS